MERARLFSPNGCDVFEMYEEVDLPEGWQIYISDGGALKLDPQRIAIPADRWGPVRYGFAFSPIHVYRTKEEAETVSAYRKTKYNGAAVPFPLGGWVWIETGSEYSCETVEERALAFFAKEWPKPQAGLDKKLVLEGHLRYIGDDCEWNGLLLDDQDIAALLPRGEAEAVYTTGPFAGDMAWETMSEQKYAELTAEVERLLGYANTPECEELCALRASFVYRLYADWGRVRITIEPLDKDGDGHCFTE